MNGETILKALAAAGLGSRRRLADAIKQGRVTRNGQVVTDFRQPVLESDVIAIDGREVNLKAEAKTYIMLNKPVGVLSASIDKRGERTALDILPPQYRRLHLYPAGRLDKDSSGLLLLTNDGGLTAPARVSKVSEAPYNYSITIHEGRKRQVRRMLAALGCPVLALKRVRLGSLRLGSLKEGEARALSAAEAGKALE
jgi:23S rRNA pseudouridine2605 synthase